MNTPKPEMTEELRKKIEHLLEHKIPLSRPEGKEILEEMIEWQTRDIAKVLKTSPSNVRVALSDHGIHKQRPPRISIYDDPEVEAFIEKCYAKPKHTREESVLARDDMVAGVNAIFEKKGLPPVTIDGIRGHVRNRYDWGFRMDRPQSGQDKTEREKEFAKELHEAVYGGALTAHGEKGVEKLWKTFCDKLDKDEGAPGFLKSLKNFQAKIDELVWTNKALEALRGIVKTGGDLEKFRKHNPYFLIEMIKEKAREYTGLTSFKQSSTFLPGIGRLSDLSKFSGDDVEFPETSLAHPYDSGITGDRWAIRILNGPSIGALHNRLILENTTRVAAANGRRMGDQCLVITNPIDIDSRQGGGPHKILRALISGLNVDIQVLDPTYRQRALKIQRDPKSMELIYQTAAELFESVIRGWHKVMVQPNLEKPKLDGDPEFNGPVLMILGLKEEFLIAGAAAWEVTYHTRVRLSELNAEIKVVENALAVAKERKDRKNIRRLDKQIHALQNEYVRTRVMAASPEYQRKYYRRLRTVIVKKFEEAIPNCKVIGQGTTYVKFGNEVIEFYVPRHARVTDALLADFTNDCGPQILARKMPNTVVICHPHALHYAEVGRQKDLQGKPGSALVMVAPVCIDDKFLRDALHDNTSNPHPIAKMVRNWQFEPGVLRLTSMQGFVNPAPLPLPFMVNAEKAIAAKKMLPSDNIWKTKYVYIFTNTDPHWGWQSKLFVTDPESGKRLGVGEAVMMMMRRAGIFTLEKFPIHFFTMNDDPTQGNHFEIHKQPHPKLRSYVDLESKILELLKGMKQEGMSRAQMITNAERMAKLSLRQEEHRGEAWVQRQMTQVFDRHMKPNLDFFDLILRRSREAGIVLKGRGEIDDPEDPYDARDIGFIDYGTGNHIAKSVDNALTEGEFYARGLRDKLQRYSHWTDKDDELERLVTAPQYSGQHIAWGTFRVPGGYEWGIDSRNSPPGWGVNWGDPLLNFIRTDKRRGNYSYIFDGMMVIEIVGDKHFRCAKFVPWKRAIMGMPGTPTDRFGEMGAFPPNTPGMTITGVPVDGPESGPILLRPLHWDQIVRYFEKPYDFDWAEFLPNPV